MMQAFRAPLVQVVDRWTKKSKNALKTVYDIKPVYIELYQDVIGLDVLNEEWLQRSLLQLLL